MRFTILIVVALLATTTAVSAKATPQCDKNHPHECTKLKHRVRHLTAAVQWQKQERIKQVQTVLNRTRGTQPFAYAARYAYLACVAFRGWIRECRPPGQMMKVGRCESGLQLDDPNPVSTASNWMQYLDSTWANAPAGQMGFPKLDVIAVAIQSEAKAMSGWHEWRASVGCHGLT